MQLDLAIIVTLSGIGVAMVGVVIAMMFWCRQEANSLRSEAKEDRKDLLQISRNLENNILSIQNEMKDFHSRLIQIEKKKAG